MLATVQRVSKAEIFIDKKIYSSIGFGCLVFVCIEKNDTPKSIKDMVSKIINFRMLNLSNKGNKPSFHKAAKPNDAKLLYDEFVREFKSAFSKVEEGKFGAFMEISLVNIGPVTFNFKT